MCLIVVMVVSICLCGGQGGHQVCLFGGLLVNDLRCCLGGGQGGHKVCLIVVILVFVVVFVVVIRLTC